MMTYIRGRNRLPDNRLIARSVLCVIGNIDTHEYHFLVDSSVRMMCVVFISSGAWVEIGMVFWCCSKVDVAELGNSSESL
jgi:hypothetical protein